MGCLCPSGEQDRRERNDRQRQALINKPQVYAQTDYRVQNNYISHNTVVQQVAVQRPYEDYQRGYVHGYQQANVQNQLAVQSQKKQKRNNSVKITNNIENLTINVINSKNPNKAIQRQLSAQNLQTHQINGNVKVSNNIKQLNVNLINDNTRKPPAIMIKQEQKPKQSKEENQFYKNQRLQNKNNPVKVNEHFRNKSQQPKQQSHSQNQRKQNNKRRPQVQQQADNSPRHFYDDD